MFETNFSEHNKIWGHKKGLWVTAPNTPVSAGLGSTVVRKFSGSWEPSCLWRGARHSENLFLIHNMNSICAN